MLATSRESLRLTGERQYLLAPLHQEGAVALFTDRATAARATFSSTERSAAALTEICRELDGLPLAIELVAPWVKLLSLEQIRERLDRHNGLLDRDNTDAPRRQRTLSATLDWSYDLLTEPERILLCRLSTFAGGWTLEAAEAVCGNNGLLGETVLQLLSRLVDKSLVVTQPTLDDGMRYGLLHVVRQYALERVAQLPEADALASRRSHLAYFLRLVEEAEPHLLGTDQALWLDRLELEHDNVRLALTCAVDIGDRVSAMRMAAALWRYWWLRGHVREGRGWLAAALTDTARTEDPHLYARAAVGDANLARVQGHYDQAEQRAKDSLALFSQVRDMRGEVMAVLALGNLAFDRGEYVTARQRYESALTQARTVGDARTVAMLLRNQAAVARATGERDLARDLTTTSLEMFEQMGDAWGIALATDDLAEAATNRGDFDAARRHYGEGLRRFRQLGDRWSTAEALESLARIATLERSSRRAVTLFAAAEAARGSVGSAIRPGDAGHHGRALAEAREHLPLAEFNSAWQEGQSMTLEQATEFALAGESQAIAKAGPEQLRTAHEPG